MERRTIREAAIGTLVLLAAGFALAPNLYAQTPSPALRDASGAAAETAAQGAADSPVRQPTDPAVQKAADSLGLRLGNLFLPGLLQVANGQREGYGYMVGGPLLWGGAALLLDYSLHPNDPSHFWELGASLGAQEIGGSLTYYSFYAFERDWSGDPSVRERPRESYLDLLAAPYRPENLFDPTVLPVLGLLTIPSLSYDAFSAYRAYFDRPSVSFFGLNVNPVEGLALESAFALGVNLFVATAEEVAFRGLLLDLFGPVLSALTFGTLHLTNIFVGLFANTPSPAWAVGQQAAGALAFGFYANFLTERSGYRLEKSITLHYWNNVLAMILGYLGGEGIGGP